MIFHLLNSEVSHVHPQAKMRAMWQQEAQHSAGWDAFPSYLCKAPADTAMFWVGKAKFRISLQQERTKYMSESDQLVLLQQSQR